jgi:hypothetical protein
MLTSFVFKPDWLLLFSLNEKNKQKNQVSLILASASWLDHNTPYGRLTKNAQSSL